MTIVPKSESLATALWRNDGMREDAMRRSDNYFPNYDFRGPKKGWKPAEMTPSRRGNAPRTLLLASFAVIVVSLIAALVFS